MFCLWRRLRYSTTYSPGRCATLGCFVTISSHGRELMAIFRVWQFTNQNYSCLPRFLYHMAKSTYKIWMSLKPLAPPLEFRSHPILPVPLWLPFLRAARHWGLLAINKIPHIPCRRACTPIQGDKTWPWANIKSYCLEHLFFQPYGSEELLPTEKPKYNLISSLQ